MGMDDRINTRIDSKLKNAAVQVFQQLGITEGEAIRMFYAQAVIQQGMPFRVNIPNQETIDAMKEGDDPENLPSYKNFSTIRNELEV